MSRLVCAKRLIFDITQWTSPKPCICLAMTSLRQVAQFNAKDEKALDLALLPDVPCSTARFVDVRYGAFKLPSTTSQGLVLQNVVNHHKIQSDRVVRPFGFPHNDWIRSNSKSLSAYFKPSICPHCSGPKAENSDISPQIRRY